MGLALVGCSGVVDDKLTREELQASAEEGLQQYGMNNPSPQVSLAVAWFVGDGLRRFDLRYYDGEGIFTLRRAGGWKGLRKRLIELFGEPTRSGPSVLVRTNHKSLNPRYVQASDEWNFPRVRRRVHFVAMAENAAEWLSSQSPPQAGSKPIPKIPLPCPHRLHGKRIRGFRAV